MQTLPSKAIRLRRYVGGFALLAFCPFLVVQAAIDPATGGDGATMYRAATESRGALAASAYLLMASALLMIPAVLAVLRQARDKGAALANAGAVLGVLGAFGHFGIAGFYLMSLGVRGGDRGEMVAFVDRINGTVELGAVAFPLLFCFSLSLLLTMWAAERAGLIARWAPVAVTIAVVGEALLPPEAGTAAKIVILAVVSIAYGRLGVGVLQRTTSWRGAGAAAPPRTVGTEAVPV